MNDISKTLIYVQVKDKISPLLRTHYTYSNLLTTDAILSGPIDLWDQALLGFNFFRSIHSCYFQRTLIDSRLPLFAIFPIDLIRLLRRLTIPFPLCNTIREFLLTYLFFYPIEVHN